MKKITLITLMLFTALSYAQVGINTNTPDASSALEIESTTGGILIPGNVFMVVKTISH